jgi:hypothetical protein
VSKTPKAFQLAGSTAPTAGRGLAPAGTGKTTASPLRTGFTWRQTADERDALDDLVKAISRRVGRSVDKAAVLAELVEVANADAEVFDRVADSLQR